jgi:uncharacterized protein (TIGR02996 family)
MMDLWAEVARRPEDDALRLVVADQLEDRGERDRAELVRVQVALCREAPGARATEALRWRERVLLARGEGPWSASLPRWEGARLQGWERGFPVWLHARDLEALWRVAPEVPPGIEGLALATLGSPELLSELPELPWLRRLVLASQWPRVPLRQLLHSPLFAQELVELSLCHMDASSEELAELLQSPRLARLRSLSLSNLAFRARDMPALVTSPSLGGLVSLELHGSHLSGTMLGREGLQRLLGWEVFPRLRSLSLSNQELEAEGVRALLSAGGALRSLSLGYDELRGMRPADDGGMRLTSLKTHQCELKDADLRALLASPALAGLVSLELSQNQFKDELFPILAAAPAWPGLRELRILGDYGRIRNVSALSQTDSGPGTFALSHLPEKAEVLELARAPWWNEIRSLRLDWMMGWRELEPVPLPPGLIELKLPREDLRLADMELPDLISLEVTGWSDLPALRTLARAPWFGSLPRLGLHHSGPGVVAALLGGAPRLLQHLDLSHDALGDEDMELLLSSPELPWLLSLDLTGGELPPGAMDRFLDPELRPLLQRLEGSSDPELRRRFW